MSDSECPDLTINLATEDDTAAFGAWLGRHVAAGDAVLLSGPIGAGKSHLARALIRDRLGNPGEEVPSPTYTLVQTYETAGTSIWHTDLYRIMHPDEVIELGLDMAFRDAVVLVEWPERLGNWRPANAIRIDLKPQGNDRIARIGVGARPALARALRDEWFARDV
jgi:tRNA threonylcarbamoyladenosine biosynthesis protein TsaE